MPRPSRTEINLHRLKLQRMREAKGLKFPPNRRVFEPKFTAGLATTGIVVLVVGLLFAFLDYWLPNAPPW